MDSLITAAARALAAGAHQKARSSCSARTSLPSDRGQRRARRGTLGNRERRLWGLRAV